MTVLQIDSSEFIKRARELRDRLHDVDPMSAESVLFFKMDIDNLRSAGGSVNQTYMAFLEAHRGLIDLEIELVKKVQKASEGR